MDKMGVKIAEKMSSFVSLPLDHVAGVFKVNI